MLKHGLAKRFAMFVLNFPGVGKSTFRVILAFGAITGLLSAFVSNTATVAMLLPTAIGILAVIAKLMQSQGVVDDDFDPLRLRVGAALMLMLAYGASVGGLLTPVGSPPNLIGRGLIEEATGEKISFLDWMIMAAPICALMFVALGAVILLINKPEIRNIDGVEQYVDEERAKLGDFSVAERNTLIAFGVTVTLWIMPGIVGIIAGTDSSAYETVGDRLDEGVIAVLGASLLFLLPTDWKEREFTLRWSDAAQDRLGHDRALRHRHHLRRRCWRRPASPRPSATARSTRLGLGSEFAITVFAVAPGDHRVRDHEQHRLGRGRGADHHPDRDGRRRQSVRAGAGGDVRRVVRLHAAGLDAAERDRLRLRHRADHDDDPVRLLLRHPRRDPDHPAAAGDGQRRRAGLTG